MVKYIFITGGVISSVGKGTTAAALGNLFQLRGLSATILKIDGYLNVDAGLMSPYEHGEVFVTDDGTEADLDLGQYERFLGKNMSKINSLTSGRVYMNVLTKERQGGFLGKTVQIIPHISNEIRQWIENTAKGFDAIIVELGGVAGEVESIPFLEAMRQIMLDNRKNTIFIHVALLPFIECINESKTKPVQKSVRDLLSHGIQPDMIVCRSNDKMSSEIIAKIASFTNVPKDMIISSPNVEWKYKIVEWLRWENMDGKILEKFECFEQYRNINFNQWKNLYKLHDTVDTFPLLRLAFVRKYIVNTDNYVSLLEALNHAALLSKINLKIVYINADDENLISQLKECDAIIIPGGFGPRGTEGMINACQYARENNVPFLGICLGFQIACIEIARNVLGLKDANSIELNPDTKDPVITDLKTQYKFDSTFDNLDLNICKNGIRLGGIPIKIIPNTRLHAVYHETEIRERFRNRFVFNSQYLESIQKKGVIFSAFTNFKNHQTAEALEVPGKAFFIAVQYHPEFKAQIFNPHPLLTNFLEKSIEKKNKQQTNRSKKIEKNGK